MWILHFRGFLGFFIRDLGSMITGIFMIRTILYRFQSTVRFWSGVGGAHACTHPKPVASCRIVWFEDT